MDLDSWWIRALIFGVGYAVGAWSSKPKPVQVYIPPNLKEDRCPHCGGIIIFEGDRPQ